MVLLAMSGLPPTLCARKRAVNYVYFASILNQLIGPLPLISVEGLSRSGRAGARVVGLRPD